MRLTLQGSNSYYANACIFDFVVYYTYGTACHKFLIFTLQYGYIYNGLLHELSTHTLSYHLGHFHG